MPASSSSDAFALSSLAQTCRDDERLEVIGPLELRDYLRDWSERFAQA